jgi:predicted RNase H-like HicB family nuclease
MQESMATKCRVLVEKDEDGWFVGSVKELPGCHTQGRTEAELMERMEEAILCCLEAEPPATPSPKFVILETVHA